VHTGQMVPLSIQLAAANLLAAPGGDLFIMSATSISRRSTVTGLSTPVATVPAMQAADMQAWYLSNPATQSIYILFNNQRNPYNPTIDVYQVDTGTGVVSTLGVWNPAIFSGAWACTPNGALYFGEVEVRTVADAVPMKCCSSYASV
jgi:hypothetical protein